MTADPLTHAKDILARLVAFPTVSDRSNLELIALRRRLSARARASSRASRRTPPATRRRCWPLSAPRSTAASLLSGHTDVVPVEGQPWTGDPFALREADGKLYGRGACDMKGFAACALAAAPAFLAARLEQAHPSAAELRRGDHLPRLARFHPPLRRRSAAPGGRDRRRADDDAGGRRAQGRGDVPHAGRRRRGAFGAARARRQRHLGRGGDRRRDRPAGARTARRSRAPTPRFDPPYATYHVGDHPRRNGAQHPGARMRRRLGVSRPAGHGDGRRAGRGATLHRRGRAAAPAPPSAGADDRDDDGRRRAAASPPSRARRRRPWRCGSPAPTPPSPCPSPPRPGISSAPGLPTVVCGPGSIAQAHKPDEFVARRAAGPLPRVPRPARGSA